MRGKKVGGGESIAICVGGGLDIEHEIWRGLLGFQRRLVEVVRSWQVAKCKSFMIM